MILSIKKNIFKALLIILFGFVSSVEAANKYWAATNDGTEKDWHLSENWSKKNHNSKGWDIKYYKGLGTSTALEAREYFKDIFDKLISYKWDSNNNKRETDSILLAFEENGEIGILSVEN